MSDETGVEPVCFEDHAEGEFCEFCPPRVSTPCECGDPGDCNDEHA